jgi:ABC-type Zn uptake system ZnuABC Zn-binding protein ZnuA
VPRQRGWAETVIENSGGDPTTVTLADASVSHDAFGYFARRYDIEVVGAIVPSQSTLAQPSAGDLADLAETIRRERVRAIFPETSVSPRLAQAIARETGATAEHTLYGDALGPHTTTACLVPPHAERCP